MINKAFAVVIAGFCLIVPALADDATPETDEGRYTFSKVADGFVRLDTQTGEVSLCSQRTVGWACQAVPEDRAVLENEIARLRRENAALKKDILARGLPLPAGAMPEPPVVRDGDHRAAAARPFRSRPHDGLRRPGVASARRGDRQRAKASAEQELSGAAWP